MGRVQFLSSPTGPPPEPARRAGGTSRRGLSLFRAGPAVLPPRRQCRLGWRRRQGRVRHWVRGGGGAPAAPSAACVEGGGGGGGRARSMSATVLVALGGDRRRARGLSPRWRAAVQGRRDAAEYVRERRWGSPCLRGGGGRGGSCRAAGSTKAPASAGGEGGGSAPVLRPVRWPVQGAPCCPPTWRRSHILRAGGECQGGRLRVIPPPPLPGETRGVWSPHPPCGATPPPGPPD